MITVNHSPHRLSSLVLAPLASPNSKYPVLFSHRRLLAPPSAHPEIIHSLEI
jgi:hypothetical protein